LPSELRRCRGYIAVGSAYKQLAHYLADTPSNFGRPSICRECYRAYGSDWTLGLRGKRHAAGGQAAPSSSHRSSDVGLPRLLDGVRPLEELVRRAGYASVVAAVAEHAVFLEPSVVGQTHGEALFPVVRDMFRRGQIETRSDGRRVLLDDNTSPTLAFLWAARAKKGPDIQFNHLWIAASDVGAYTALWNICATPAFLAKTTDGANHPAVTGALRYRAYELYGHLPVGARAPERPSEYESLRWAPHPPAVASLETELRARLQNSPKSRPAIAAREIGWLYSGWVPDPTV
jgi:hypothetical protein